MKQKRQIVSKAAKDQGQQPVRAKRLRGTKKGPAPSQTQESQAGWQLASVYTQRAQKQAKRLRKLKQMGFPAICQMTEKGAGKVLHSLGFRQKESLFKCPWHGCTLSWKGQPGKQQRGRCTKNKCKFVCRICCCSSEGLIQKPLTL